MIPYGRQDITPEDIAAVEAVLHSDFLTQGPAVPGFEKALTAYCGAARGVAVCNATAALHMACLALGLGPGDRLWTSPNTFVASANCGLYCGAEVDFVDTDPLSYNMSVEALEAKLVQAAASNSLPKVVIPVHFAGQSCEMREIHALGQKYGFRIIEDASHAVGGRYLGEAVGNCRYSDITIFSFHPVKIITTGEGGMALTNDPALADHMERLRSHGITRDPAQMESASDGPWHYQQIELGYNFRITDMQAALGHSQLQRLDDYVARRHAIAARYDAALADLPLSTPHQHPDSRSALHLYPIRLHATSQRRQVFEGLRAAGIGVNVHYIPVHTQPHYRRLGFRDGDFPEAENYYAGAISLPMFPTLTPVQQDEVIGVLKRLLG
ncbi:MAG: UDP-4-amino-4,6-dideoxy-N-acetyl-beta-L-altrosamine transaminase [Zoogloea sp.]|jgi:UDP-4-amino-4,6-dideoxy-N-acetyl-beta-L-altrosamine transaminase|nr:UDP-4-amino-4,6-dideoxy-N-acetyl-beta-L-altrosamine transaminase [Zoogloea sp.]